MESEVVAILEASPAFVPQYLAMVSEADEHPGAPAVFAAFADYVAVLAGVVHQSLSPLAGCLAGVEAVARVSPDAEDLIVWSFFDALSADDIRRVEPWLGPRSRALLDEADQAPSTR